MSALTKRLGLVCCGFLMATALGCGTVEDFRVFEEKTNAVANSGRDASDFGQAFLDLWDRISDLLH